jgi:hypothetical protein
MAAGPLTNAGMPTAYSPVISDQAAPDCSVAEDDPVGRGGDTVQTLRTQDPKGLRNREQAGERSAAPREHLHHAVTSTGPWRSYGGGLPWVFPATSS